MAEDTSRLFQRLQSEVTCPLCLDIFTDPRKLPCDHVYCRVCLHGLALMSITGTISCPECRMDIPLPANGVRDFPTLHQVNRLLDVYQNSLEYVEPEAATPQPATCEVHSSQPLALYCETCEKLVCRDCALTSCAKQNHEHGFIDNMVKRYESILSKELEPIKKIHQAITNAVEAIATSKRDLLRAKEAKLQQIEEQFDTLVEMLSQERAHFNDYTEKLFKEQNDLYSTKEKDFSEELTKLDSVIKSVNTASQKKSKPEFLLGAAQKQKDILKVTKSFQIPPLSPPTLPEKKPEICSSEDFQDFCHLKNFWYTKSDPLKCHLERHLDLSNVTVNASSDVALFLNPSNFKKEKFNLAAQLHCCSDDSSQNVSAKKVTNEKYSLLFVPRKRGKHELHIKYNDAHVNGSPLPIFVTIPPHQLKRQFSKMLVSVRGIKFLGGNIYSSLAHNEVRIMDPATLSLKSVIKVPNGLNEVVMDDSFIYATNITLQKVLKMNMNGSVVKSTGSRGHRPGQFDFPNGIRLSKDNELYICDTNNHRIQVFDKDLSFIRTFGGKGSDNGCFNGPVDLDFDEDGNVYVADEINSRIQVLTPQGQHLRNIGSYWGELALPLSVAIHRDMVYVTDSESKHVSVFKTTGIFVAKFGSGSLAHPESIAVDDNGFVYVTDSRSKIVKF